ncbi:MAG: metal-dependent hydrolase [Paenibacillus sp.]|jgi:L-ascorbate metabolism protein UlaG (beta-lactamase superfamily)|nr:metal-dependent hydrolase [Paenibacillus sp.]
MQLVYHGHSCVQISDGNQSVIIDPFLNGNPAAVTKTEDIRVQYILLTHGHSDHTADVEAIARANDATVIATFELATYFSWKGLKTIGMNLGGTVDLGFAKAKMVQAFHSSSIVLEEEQKIEYAGMPGGFLLSWKGLTLLHAGDTALFGDMKIIGELNDIDYALLPIGDLFTMGPADALIAAEWLRAKKVIPVHHSTFPAIAQDTAEFVRQLNSRGIEGYPLKPGEELQLVK